MNSSTCAPLTTANIVTASPNPTWLTYLNSDDVFVAAPATPSPWCTSSVVSGRSHQAAHLPAGVQALARTYFSSHPTGKLMYLHHDSKGHALAATLRLQAALGVRNTRLTTGAASVRPPSPNPGRLGGVQPALLGNAVMETYVSPTSSPSMSSFYSCMYCHSLFMQGYYKNFTSDFSLLVNAQR